METATRLGHAALCPGLIDSTKEGEGPALPRFITRPQSLAILSFGFACNFRVATFWTYSISRPFPASPAGMPAEWHRAIQRAAPEAPRTENEAMTNTNATTFMFYTTPTERRITRALITAGLKRGWTVSVYDSAEGEGQWTVKRATDLATVTDALATTEGDVLHFTNADERGIGQVVLIWGNDEDVISDCSDNAAIAEIVAEAQE